MFSEKVVSIILGGGQGSRLYPLTDNRSKPAVPIAGEYRLVDVPISNFINSNFYLYNDLICSKIKSYFGDLKIEKGGLIVNKGDNQKVINFEQTVVNLIAEKYDYVALESGFAKNGGDLGGENYPLLKAPKVLVLSGSGVSNIDFGQVWFFMDQVIEYPISTVEVQMNMIICKFKIKRCKKSFYSCQRKWNSS